MSNQFEPATREAIEDLLERLKFVDWDRFTTGEDYHEDRYINIYGWIDRDDEYKDFVLLRFWPDLGDDGIIGFMTSSDRHTNEIHKRLFGGDLDGHNDCQRVEHTFDVENAIEIDTGQTTLTDGGVSNSSADTERRYWVKYTEDAGWGGKTKKALSTVECDSVTVSNGLVRFIDSDGNDVWTIRADRVLEYEGRSLDTDTDDQEGFADE